MFSKLALVATTAFALLAVAAPNGAKGTTEQGQQCQTGPQLCCQDIQPSDSPQSKGLLGLLGIVLDAVIPIGVTCSPITVIGAAGGSNCATQPVCCDQSDFGGLGGLLNLGCTPINVSL